MVVGALYENAYNIKFEAVEVDERFIVLAELDVDGKKKSKGRRKYTKSVFAGLIMNKSFDTTRFARREGFLDLRGLGVNEFFNR